MMAYLSQWNGSRVMVGISRESMSSRRFQSFSDSSMVGYKKWKGGSSGRSGVRNRTCGSTTEGSDVDDDGGETDGESPLSTIAVEEP